MVVDVSDLFVRLRRKGELRSFWREQNMEPMSLQRHPLGFYVFRLAAAGELALRLHYWPAVVHSYQVGFEIHDHSYELTSEIVHGGLKQIIFGLSKMQPSTHSVYAVEYSNEGSSLLTTNESVAAFEKSQNLLLPKSVNQVRVGEFHRVTSAGREGTISLALTKQVGGQARVLGPLNAAPILRFRRNDLTPEECSAIRAEVRHLLG